MAINEIDLLAEVLDQDTDQEYQAEPSRFQIDSLDKLDWAVRKCMKIERDRDKLVETAQRQIIRLQAFIKSTDEKAQQNLNALHAMMTPFTRQMLAGGKAKSFKTPSGKVGFRSQSPEIVKDDDTLLKFIESNGRQDLIETVRKPKWGELKKELLLIEWEDGTVQYSTKDGEVVPVTVNLREDKLVVEG